MAMPEPSEPCCAVCQQRIQRGQSVVGTVDRMMHLDCWIADKERAGEGSSRSG